MLRRSNPLMDSAPAVKIRHRHKHQLPLMALHAPAGCRPPTAIASGQRLALQSLDQGFRDATWQVRRSPMAQQVGLASR
jgi:hypothetical protein